MFKSPLRSLISWPVSFSCLLLLLLSPAPSPLFFLQPPAPSPVFFILFRLFAPYPWVGPISSLNSPLFLSPYPFPKLGPLGPNSNTSGLVFISFKWILRSFALLRLPSRNPSLRFAFASLRCFSTGSRILHAMLGRSVSARVRRLTEPSLLVVPFVLE